MIELYQVYILIPILNGPFTFPFVYIFNKLLCESIEQGWWIGNYVGEVVRGFQHCTDFRSTISSVLSRATENNLKTFLSLIKMS